MANAFEWKDEYSVQIESIDTQHKEFFKIANDLVALSENPAPDEEEMLLVAGQLGSYAQYHLSTEEKYFMETHYPESREHTEMHDLFRHRVEELLAQVREQKATRKITAKKLAEFAGFWLLDHIVLMDRKYSAFFVAKGVK